MAARLAAAALAVIALTSAAAAQPAPPTAVPAASAAPTAAPAPPAAPPADPAPRPLAILEVQRFGPSIVEPASAGAAPAQSGLSSPTSFN